MANKFFLVPAQQFQHMLSVSKDPTSAMLASEEPALTESQQKLKRLLKYKSKKGKELSVRKALYDQELGRYLRLRRERVNRPVKVEVMNKGGAKIIVDPKVQPGGVPSADFAQETPLPTISPAQAQGAMRSAPAAVMSARSAAPRDVQEVDMGDTPTPVARSVPARRGKRVVAQAMREGQALADLSAKREDFTKHLLAKRQEVGITAEGEVLKGGKPIKKSNFDTIMRSLFASKRQLKENTPKGTWQLISRIRKDRELNSMLNTYLPQYGGGIGLYRSHRPPRVLSSSSFKPLLWN